MAEIASDLADIAADVQGQTKRYGCRLYNDLVTTKKKNHEAGIKKKNFRMVETIVIKLFRVTRRLSRVETSQRQNERGQSLKLFGTKLIRDFKKKIG